MKPRNKVVLVGAGAAVGVALGIGGVLAATSVRHTDARAALGPLAAKSGDSVAGRRRKARQSSSIKHADHAMRTHATHDSADGKLTRTEADIVALYLDGGIKPDHALRDVWKKTLRSAADYLGTSVDTLQSNLAAGQSLADIAARRNRSVAGLGHAVLATSNAALARAVADRDLTERAKADILDLMRAHLSEALAARI